MVDVSRKEDTLRTAEARAFITLPANAFSLVNTTTNDDKSSRKIEINSAKGPVFSTAIIAGTMAAKKTSDIIPFCHSISLSHCNITIDIDEQRARTLQINCRVKTVNKTGVEMEALVGASTAALCIYDMLKAISHDIVISNIHLINKSGGKREIKDTKEVK
jgi:cyclic pyranopterin phosphate synthase